MYGIAYIMSTMRIITASTRPPRKPAVAPQATPIRPETSVPSSPTSSETRPPSSVRTSRSRPSSSVPNQWAFCSVGARLIADQSLSVGSCDSSSGPTKHASAISTRSTRLTSAARCCTKRAKAFASGPRGRDGAGASAGTPDIEEERFMESVPDTRIEPRVGEVDQQIDQHGDHRRQHNETQHERVVANDRAVDDELS